MMETDMDAPLDTNDPETNLPLDHDGQSNAAFNTKYACGPWHAWSTVFGAWLMQFCVVGYISAFGVMQTFYVHGFLSNESASSISWIGTMQLFLDLALASVAGLLLDKGYFRHLVITGSALFVFCLFMLSLANPHHYYQVFLSQGLGMGTGVGLIYLPTSAVVSQHFKQGKAFPMGLVVSGGSLGAVVFSIALNYLLNSSLTFGWAIRITAFIVLGLLILANLLVFEPPQNRPPSLSDADPATHDNSLREKDNNQISQPLPADDSARSEASAPTQAPALFWDTKYLLLLAMGFACGLGMWFPSYYVQLYAQQHHVGTELSFYALAILNLSNMFGRILPNWLGDKWGSLNVYMPTVLCAGALQFAMFGCSTPYGLVLFNIFYGFFFGTVVSLYLPVVAYISKDGVDVGKRMGIALLPVGISSLIGNPISGAILGSDYMWWKGITFAAVTLLTGGVFVTSIKLLSVWKR